MLLSRFVTARRGSLMQLGKTGVAAVLAWLVCQLVFPEQVPLFGAIAALLCVQENVTQSLSRGVERVAGVILGVVVAITLGALFGPQAWLFAVIIALGLLVGWLLKMTTGATVQIAITGMLMIALGGLSVGFGVERIVETLIGAVIGIVINALIVAPVVVTPAQTAINQLGFDTATALRRLADALTADCDEDWLFAMLTEARSLMTNRNKIEGLLRSASESLQLNPRSHSYRAQLAEDVDLMNRLHPIVSQVIGMSRALYDHYDGDLIGDQNVLGMAEELRRAAHDLELFLNPSLAGLPGPGSAAQEQPALTKPYTIARPHPTQWVLIGALMEDLRRVREGIVSAQRGDSPDQHV